MGAILGFLDKVRYEALALVFGALFILTSFFGIDDITKLKLSPLTHPIYPLLVVGVLLAAVSAIPAISPFWPGSFVGAQLPTTAKPDSVTATIGQNTL